MRSVEPRLESRPQTETWVLRARSGHRSGAFHGLWSRVELALRVWCRVGGTVLLLGATVSSGCKDTTCRGVITERGCEEECQNDQCADDGRCVDNQCAARCDTDADCNGGSCERARADDGSSGKFCSGGSEAPNDGEDDEDGGGSTPAPAEGQCRENADCAEATGQRCVEGVCRLTCELHAHCGAAGTCTEDATDVEGNAVVMCRFDDFPRGPGEYGTACPNGANDCSEDFRCIGAGEGDSSAYCTAVGCNGDAECPTGLFCSHNRTAAPPCENACGQRGEPTDPRCIPAELIGEGRAFRCNEGQLELRLCLSRGYCSECETDADCRSLAGQVCAQGADGTKSCSVLCDPGTNSCPWGSASSCQVWDSELGLPTCGHRSGSCRGTGASCDPCVDDRDCPTGFCSFNSFTSEQFCVDETAVCACPEGEAVCLGGGCPETPGGLTMNCVSRQEGAPPDACYGAPTIAGDETSALGCWPSEPQ